MSAPHVSPAHAPEVDAYRRYRAAMAEAESIRIQQSQEHHRALEQINRNYDIRVARAQRIMDEEGERDLAVRKQLREQDR